MRAVAQKLKLSQQTEPAKSVKLGGAASGQSRDVHSILHLHRMIGNHVVQQLLQNEIGDLAANEVNNGLIVLDHDRRQVQMHESARGRVQPKLKVGIPGDKCEQEADRVADQVMRAPAAQLQPAYACGGEYPRCQAEQTGLVHSLIRSEVVPTTRQIVAPPIVRDVLRSPGRSMDASARSFFEPRFGHSFDRVRIHTGPQAAEAAQAVRARAFTVGDNVVFGAGIYSPDSFDGRRLLAHELAHVVQQQAGKGDGVPAVQFDLARPLPNPEAAAAPLTEEQVRAALRYNRVRFDDPYVFAVMRDVLGIPRFPAVVDEEFVQAITVWQAQNNLTVDGRLTGRTTATIVAELRAEGALVPALLRDAVRVELEAAFTFNERRNFDGQTIRILQGVVGAPVTGAWDDATIQRIKDFQRTNALDPDGMVGPATLRVLLETLVAASEFDDAIHVIIDAFDFPTVNLAAITFDATVTGADAVTSGTIGTGQPQTVRVGPSTFTAGYEHMIRIIGHELQHVQQRSGATPITNQHVREFLAFAWEALSTDSPPLSGADRVTHARIAIQHWNRAPVAERTPHQLVRDRLDRLVAAGGVGNF